MTDSTEPMRIGSAANAGITDTATAAYAPKVVRIHLEPNGFFPELIVFSLVIMLICVAVWLSFATLQFAFVSTPEALEVANERRRKVTIGLLARVNGHILSERIDRLLHDAYRLAIAGSVHRS